MRFSLIVAVYLAFSAYSLALPVALNSLTPLQATPNYLGRETSSIGSSNLGNQLGSYGGEESYEEEGNENQEGYGEDGNGYEDESYGNQNYEYQDYGNQYEAGKEQGGYQTQGNNQGYRSGSNKNYSPGFNAGSYGFRVRKQPRLWHCWRITVYSRQ
uniref:Uncharacterized protein n=1 Tax=Phakopsora pachyrhizi TaxID=170000 RepID=A0A0S1MKK1_PHAPC